MRPFHTGAGESGRIYTSQLKTHTSTYDVPTHTGFADGTGIRLVQSGKEEFRISTTRFMFRGSTICGAEEAERNRTSQLETRYKHTRYSPQPRQIPVQSGKEWSRISITRFIFCGSPVRELENQGTTTPHSSKSIRAHTAFPRSRVFAAGD